MDRVTAHLGLAIAGKAVRTELTVPTGPVRVGDLLPVLQALCDVVVGAAARANASNLQVLAGKPVAFS
jgi:hypothetical protein